MKKTFVLVLLVLLCLLPFSGCKKEPAEPPPFSFALAEKVIPVKQLVIADGNGKLEDVGHVQETRGRFCLSGAYMDGQPKQDGELYYYTLPDAFVDLRKRENVDGVLLYNGVPYGAGVADDGVETVYTLDETLAAQSWTEFYNRALEAEK